ncbi:hypothetical protein [Phenylobacterium sp.]|jgi:hypothetical protein|uniref:hypothetical protein n=1 Tax=Phenylobacterium sp. TaxID=1871053 RepID=UPI002F9223E8
MANDNDIQSDGRDENGAQPLNASDNKGGPERYPSVRQDDSVESGEQRSFDPSADAPTPRQGAGDSSQPTSANEGRIGPGGDPAEGKR